MRPTSIYYLQTDRNDENENTLYYPWSLFGPSLVGPLTSVNVKPGYYKNQKDQTITSTSLHLFLPHYLAAYKATIWYDPLQFNKSKKRMEITEEIQIELNYKSGNLSKAMKKLRPVVFKSGSSYLCVMRASSRSEIVGYGQSISEAISDWGTQLVFAMIQRSKDPFVKRIKQILQEREDDR